MKSRKMAKRSMLRSTHMPQPDGLYLAPTDGAYDGQACNDVNMLFASGDRGEGRVSSPLAISLADSLEPSCYDYDAGYCYMNAMDCMPMAAVCDQHGGPPPMMPSPDMWQVQMPAVPPPLELVHSSEDALMTKTLSDSIHSCSSTTIEAVSNVSTPTSTTTSSCEWQPFWDFDASACVKGNAAAALRLPLPKVSGSTTVLVVVRQGMLNAFEVEGQEEQGDHQSNRCGQEPQRASSCPPALASLCHDSFKVAPTTASTREVESGEELEWHAPVAAARSLESSWRPRLRSACAARIHSGRSRLSYERHGRQHFGRTGPRLLASDVA